MKKKIISLLILFILTGCNAEYNVEINSKTIKDDIFIYDSIEKIEAHDEDEIFNTFIKFEGFFDNFNKELKDKDRRKVGYQYTYELEKDDFSTFSLARQCYDDFSMTEENGIIKIKTSEKMVCLDEYDELEKVTINLTSTYKVENSNADYTDGEVYTWYINKNNYKNKPIEINLKKVTDIKNSLPIHIFIFIGVIILIISFIFIKKKYKRGYTE